ncbi:hypothetical protein AYO44_03490 [Planctomycetaceae bacterium SCGC AG-212-F19]|nr:hypothetical protein AYO44_03490 [Planctomycetaceae bacterium SCGC AG-212-F19]
MRRRWRLVLNLLLFTACLGPLAVPAVHWRLIGWVRGEAFYLDRPTSYWRGEVARIEEVVLSVQGFEFPAYYDPRLVGVESSWEQCLHWVGFPARQMPLIRPTGSAGIDSMPVMMELLTDADPKVRRFAVHGIHDLWPHAWLLPPPLRTSLREGVEQAATDDDLYVRRVADHLRGQFVLLEVDETHRLNVLEEMKHPAENRH